MYGALMIAEQEEEQGGFPFFHKIIEDLMSLLFAEAKTVYCSIEGRGIRS